VREEPRTTFDNAKNIHSIQSRCDLKAPVTPGAFCFLGNLFAAPKLLAESTVISVAPVRHSGRKTKAWNSF
jgi:hypothetical protein